MLHSSIPATLHSKYTLLGMMQCIPEPGACIEHVHLKFIHNVAIMAESCCFSYSGPVSENHRLTNLVSLGELSHTVRDVLLVRAHPLHSPIVIQRPPRTSPNSARRVHQLPGAKPKVPSATRPCAGVAVTRAWFVRGWENVDVAV